MNYAPRNQDGGGGTLIGLFRCTRWSEFEPMVCCPCGRSRRRRRAEAAAVKLSEGSAYNLSTNLLHAEAERDEVEEGMFQTQGSATAVPSGPRH
ncbi:hypothetical protein GGTG_00269 [Gaeumannomyces tritici R3-111a-1]|uniref:Uncharacterized protein n=1 Tax=Gaeumannomyces tritici (strain R3-111a-1) TaxID=644352 RepID=J3NG76_GAET3|nr:hypothetical protein GGTG_00269 [Gaeumannomyces tritici R3-111a-1]EJT80266.1 hypothetical protein GGTG_00269 [Gaeumannomyces tritici R3-111a-1]